MAGALVLYLLVVLVVLEELVVELNFDLAATFADVVGDAMAGALILHLLVVELVVK